MKVWDSRLLRLLAVLTALSLAYFGAEVAIGSLVPSLVDWAVIIGTDALAVVVCWRAAVSPTLPPAAAAYWRTSSYALVLIGLSMVIRAIDAEVDQPLDAVAGVVHGIGAAVMVWALFRLPIARRNRAERLALVLDMVTTMAAAAVFVWHTAVFQTLGSDGVTPATVATSAGMMAAGLGAFFLLAKLALTGGEALSRGALQMIALGAVFGGLGAAVSTVLANRPDVNTFVLIVPIAGLVTAIGARRQLAETVAAVGRPERPRRRYSLLPYFAVAAVDVLLIVVLIQDSEDRIVVAVFAVLLTGLVIFRQIQAFRENDRNEQRFRLLVQNSTEIVMITDEDRVIRYVSAAVEQVLGRSPEEHLGGRMGDRLHPDDAARVRAEMARISGRPGTTMTTQARVRHTDGSYRWLELISANLTHEPSINGIVTNARDITEMRNVQDRLSHEATHDALTGLPNRVLFGERIEENAARAVEHRFSVVLVDLDDFKIVNDTLGHGVGDELLVAVAGRMREHVRPTDTVARLGGDEFAILLEGATAEQADRVLARIADALGVPVVVGEHLLAVKASFGVVAGVAGDDPDELMRHADIAMYESKVLGEGRQVHYRPGMTIRQGPSARQ